MEKNFYNMNNFGKSTLEKNKRIQNQAASFLAEYDRSLKESLEAQEENKMNMAMSNARLSYSSVIARSRARVTNLTEEINYTVNSSIIGMTEMISQVVENALLLDESEFAELNPNYKKEIREIVSGFLREADINENITNEDTLAIMEHVARTLPSVKEGKNLTEEDLSSFVNLQSPLEINRSIRNLSGDVSNRVATLMEKEQKRAEKTEKDVKRAVNKKEKNLADEKDPSVANPDEIIAALEAGELEVEDVDAMLQNGDISQDVYDKIVDAYMDHAEGADDNVDSEEAIPAAEGEGVNSETDTSGQLAAQAQNPVVGDEMGATDAAEGDVPPMEDQTAMGGAEMTPADPTMDPTAGADASMNPSLGDTAMNDPAAIGGGAPSVSGVAPGMPKKQVQMLPDGTMNINIYENSNYLVRETPRCGLIESLAVNDAMNRLAEGKSYNPDLSLANAIMYVTITETMNAMGLMDIDDQAYNRIIAEAGGNPSPKENNVIVSKSIKGTDINDTADTKMANKVSEELKKNSIINESVLVNQYVPVINNRVDSNDFAERIRQRKLMRENGNIDSNNNLLID